MTASDYSLEVPQRPDEILSAVSWPSLTAVRQPYIESGDVLVMCAGFESRAVFSLRRILEHRRLEFRVIVIRYLPEYLENRFDEIRSLLVEHEIPFQELTYDRRSPSGVGEEIVEKVRSDESVVVDVSGMSRLLIVQSLVTLIRSALPRVSVVYTEALEYPPSASEFAASLQEGCTNNPSFLSSGIFEIVATPELSSVAMVGQPVRLIAFPSYDPSQLSNLLQELQPTYTELIHGVPPLAQNDWRLDAVRTLNRRSISELRNKTDHNASTLDYRETLRALLNIYADNGVFDRIVVSPTGSKLQALAVAIVCSVLTDIQLVYPTPEKFIDPSNYTIGERQIYQVELPRVIP